jgi:hypothetical protein
VIGFVRCNGGVDDFSLPGFDVEELVGFGGSGEVWRARDSSSGELVALKRLRGDAATPISARQLQREAALLATVHHDHIVVLRSVVQTSDGLVLVLDYAEGGSLAAVLGVRGTLSAGEVVTIGAPLAAALADIHARGLTHGDVTPANIVFDRSGKPLLADLGVASLIGDPAAVVGRTPGYADPVDGVGSATDVHGLAAVCFSALAGCPPYSESDRTIALVLGPLAPGAPAALVAAIETGLDRDPAARPDAAAFGRALFASCSPVAVGLARASQRTGGTAAPTTEVRAGALPAIEVRPIPEPPPRSRFRRMRAVGRHRWATNRRVLVGRMFAVACVVALLGAAVAIGIVWGWADHGHRASASTSSPSGAVLATDSAPPPAAALAAPPASAIAAAPESPDWLSIVGALDRSRDGAFADADANELDAIYVPGSGALAADRATLGSLVGAGQRVHGLQFLLESVRLVSKSPGEVTLMVVDTLASYDVVDAGGAITHVPGRGVRTWTVVLRAQASVEGGWQIASVAPA